MDKPKPNPLKILLVVAAIIVLLLLAWGRLSNPPPLQWAGQARSMAVAAAVLWLSALGLSLFLNWRREPRRKWQAFQALWLLALTGLAVQQTGGLGSPLLGAYLVTGFLAVLRASGPMQWLVPLGALAIEAGAIFNGPRFEASLPWLVTTAAMLSMAYLLGRLFLRRTVSALSPRSGEDAEPQAEPVDLIRDLSALTSLAHSCLKARTAALFLLDEQGHYLKLSAHKSYSSEIINGALLDVSRSFLGWVVRERQGLLYPNFDRDAKTLGYYRSSEPLGSLAAVPVLDESAVQGVLVADSDSGQVFGDREKLLLTGFAEEAGRILCLHHRHSTLGLERERLRQWNSRLEMMASRLKITEVVAILRELVPTLVPCDHLVLLQTATGSSTARILLSDPVSAGFPQPGVEMDISGTLAEQTVRLKEWRMVDDFYRRTVPVARYHAGERQDHGFRSVLMGPLLYEDTCHYVLSLESRQPFAYEAELDTIHIIANQFALALRSAAQYEEKETMATRDGLTGLANHRHFQEYLAETIRQYQGRILSLALFDIDFFKKLNDSYGHPVGDEVLRELARRLRQQAASDFAARYGGEEFVVVWPGRGEYEAAKLAEAVRLAIEERAFATSAGELPVTVSMGLACFPGDARDKTGLVKAADQALYAAKKAGRNRVIRFSSLASQTQ